MVPESRFATRRNRAEVFIAGNMASDLKPRTFYAQLRGLIFFVDEIVPGNPDGRLDGVFIHRHQPPDGSHEVIVAKHGNLYPFAFFGLVVYLMLAAGLYGVMELEYKLGKPEVERQLAAIEKRHSAEKGAAADADKLHRSALLSDRR